MGFFDKLWKKEKTEVPVKNVVSGEQSQGYDPKYPDVCRFIWKNYVPKRGQADNLQGELLREIEKLRWEAQENGNINWDEDFLYFCDFICKTLTQQAIFSEEEKEETVSIMDTINAYGTYAEKANSGEIPYDEIDMCKIAYTEDDLYDRICDKIAWLHIKNPEPMPYKKNEDIGR